MEFVNNLLEYMNDDNARLIKNIVKLMSKNNINNKEELIEYVHKNIDSRFKDSDDKLKHCLDLIENSSYTMDSMDGEESYSYLNLKDDLEDEDCDVILTIIKLFELCKFEQVYILEAYDYIMQGTL